LIHFFKRLSCLEIVRLKTDLSGNGVSEDCLSGEFLVD